MAGSSCFVFSTLAPGGCVYLSQGQLSSFQARWIAVGCRETSSFNFFFFLSLSLFFNRSWMEGAYKVGSGGLGNGNGKERGNNGRAQWPCLKFK